MVPFTGQNPNAETTDPHTIILRGMDEVEYDDAPGIGQIRPGMLLERAGDSVQAHSAANGYASPMFAVNRRRHGMLADDLTLPTELDNGVTSALYRDGDTVLFAGFDKLHRVWGLLADGFAVADTDALVSNGDGTFRPVDTVAGETEDTAIVEALEAVDTTGETDGPDRIRLEVTT